VAGARVAEAKLGYKSLGTSSEKVTKAQHCRAEVYLDNYGWVPALEAKAPGKAHPAGERSGFVFVSGIR
jgi:hypothetical protein